MRWARNGVEKMHSEKDQLPVDRLASFEQMQSVVGEALTGNERSRLGQYFTPSKIAQFMASMLTPASSTPVHLLDAGAGPGILFAAAVQEMCSRQVKPSAIHVTAYEIDTRLAVYARQALRWCEMKCAHASIPFEGTVVEADFIESAVQSLQGDLFSQTRLDPVTIAILNPPYRKIRADSRERRLLRHVGIEETNLYTAFLSLALKLIGDGGELVAITPRSFCNGPYFKRFRRQLHATMSILRIHVFDTRDTAFRQDNVLQEMLILHASKIAMRTSVMISSSAEPSDDGALMQCIGYEQMIKPHDVNAIVHIPTDQLSLRAMSTVDELPCLLSDLNLHVSTGRVVEFRTQNHLRFQADVGYAPLISSRHLVDGKIMWPHPRAGKPEALAINPASSSLLIPATIYTVVKRMTAKEERHRVVAAVYEPAATATVVAFENHINYFHQNGEGLDHDFAYGLAAYLNSTLVDTYIRQFNGHTQINASDLRILRYPSAEQLRMMGRAVSQATQSQTAIDRILQEVLATMTGPVEINPVQARQRIEEAMEALRQLHVPRAQQNERSALTLLALLDLPPDQPWTMASSPLRGVTQMMDFFARYYGKVYAPNTRETVRRQTLHQFMDSALVRINPDNSDRPVNSGQTVYQIEAHTLESLRSFGSPGWDSALRQREALAQELIKRYAQERLMSRIPLKLKEGASITLSPGGQNILIERIVHEFAERFVPDGRLIYIGDAENKFGYYDAEALTALGVTLDIHGKAPDIIIYDEKRRWLCLIEAVSSHGPMNLKRKDELERLFAGRLVPLVFVSAFQSRKALMKHMSEIAWETEVWIADEPSHLIHFDGVQRIEPYLSDRDPDTK